LKKKETEKIAGLISMGVVRKISRWWSMEKPRPRNSTKNQSPLSVAG